MTGFGKAACETNGKKYVVEIKSLNGKQLDASVRLPAMLREKDLEIRNLLSEKLGRGKVDFSIYQESLDSDKSARLNVDSFKVYYQQLSDMADLLKDSAAKSDLFSIVCRMPEVWKTDSVEIEDNEWEAIQLAINEAIAKHYEFRKQEGENLQVDILARVNTILAGLAELTPYEEARIETIKNRINQNLDEFAKNAAIDQNRFEQEIIYYLEKIDITEEKVRLANHCHYFMDTCKAGNDSGKKLGFISQEMGREINTLGSKANQADIQKIVVGMKDELEKIKEQLMNIL